MKTLLIYPPFSPLFHGFKNKGIGSTYLGLPALSAYLKEAGHEAPILDLNIKIYLDAKEEDKILWNDENYTSWIYEESFLNDILPRFECLLEKWVNIILESNSMVIGFYVSTVSRWMALFLAKRIK